MLRSLNSPSRWNLDDTVPADGRLDRSLAATTKSPTMASEMTEDAGVIVPTRDESLSDTGSV